MTNSKEHGSLAFWLDHDQTDWATNDRAYKFPISERPPVHIAATKERDHTLRLIVQGPLHRGFSFKIPLSKVVADSTQGIRVELEWSNNKLTLSLNGTLIETIDARSLPESKRLNLKKPRIQ